MTAMDKIGSRWEHPKTGEVRYYVNDWYKYGGLELDYYNTGNISDAWLDGKEISNCEAKRLLADIRKVYITEDGEVHVVHANGDWTRYPNWGPAVADGIKAALAQEVA